MNENKKDDYITYTSTTILQIYIQNDIHNTKNTNYDPYQLHLSKCSSPNNFNHLIVHRFHA